MKNKIQPSNSKEIFLMFQVELIYLSELKSIKFLFFHNYFCGYIICKLCVYLILWLLKLRANVWDICIYFDLILVTPNSFVARSSFLIMHDDDRVGISIG